MIDFDELIGVDGERVWASKLRTEIVDGKAYRQLRLQMTPLDGMISLLTSGGEYEQWRVGDAYWDPLWRIMTTAGIDYFRRLKPIIKLMRNRCELWHAGAGNYNTRFGQPFWPEAAGGTVIRDRAYARFMLRADGRGPVTEHDIPDMLEENMRLRELQDKSYKSEECDAK